MQIDKREKQSDINVTIIFLADWEQKANKSNTKKIVKRLCTHTHTHTIYQYIYIYIYIYIHIYIYNYPYEIMIVISMVINEDNGQNDDNVE